MSLASLFSPLRLGVFVSPLCLAPTLPTHTTKTTTSPLIPARLVMSCLARGMRRRPQQCSPACRIHTNIQREEPAVTKQHAPKYSWESPKGYKANMCGEHQTLNVGSGVRKVASLIFMESPSVKWLWLFLFFVSAFLQSPLIKTRRTRHTKRPDGTQSPSKGLQTIECQRGFVDTNPCSDSSELPTKPFLCETPASVYFHRQG